MENEMKTVLGFRIKDKREITGFVMRHKNIKSLMNFLRKLSQHNLVRDYVFLEGGKGVRKFSLNLDELPSDIGKIIYWDSRHGEWVTDNVAQRRRLVLEENDAFNNLSEEELDCYFHQKEQG